VDFSNYADNVGIKSMATISVFRPMAHQFERMVR
jgi:hypothetical protein